MTNSAPQVTIGTSTVTGSLRQSLTPRTISGVINFTDADSTDTHAITPSFIGTTLAGGLNPLGQFNVIVNPNNSKQLLWTYTIADAAIIQLGNNQIVTEQFNVRIKDQPAAAPQSGISVFQVVNITLRGDNDSLTLLSNSNNVLSFADLDLSDTHTVTITPTGTPLGTLGYALADSTSIGTGSVALTYTATSLTSLPQGQTNTDTFTVLISDGQGGTISQVVTYTVTGANDVPVLGVPVATNSTSGTIALSDADTGDTHSVDITSTGTTGTFTAPLTDGVILYNYAADSATLTALGAGQTATETFTVTVTDAQGATASRNVVFTLTGSNDAPTLTLVDGDSATGTATSSTSAVVTTSGTITYADPDTSDVPLITVANKTGTTPLGTLTTSRSGNVLTWTYSITPAQAAQRSAASVNDQFTISVNDQHGGTTSQDVTVSTNLTSAAPTATMSSVGDVLRITNGGSSPVFDGDNVIYRTASGVKTQNLITGVVSNGTLVSNPTNGSGAQVYSSTNTSLVDSDTNGQIADIILQQSNGTRSIISRKADGTQVNGGSFAPAFNPAGNKVVFYSAASNLVSGDTNGFFDVFLKDLNTNAITRISANSSGAQANGNSITSISDSATPVSSNAVFSADGQRVLFTSNATNLATGATNGRYNIYEKNLVTNEVKLISAKADGTVGNNDSLAPLYSPDGLKVAFRSRASNLIVGDNNGVADVFIKDLITGVVTRVSEDASGTAGNRSSDGTFSWSSDGSRIAFTSLANNLSASDSNNTTDVFIKTLSNPTLHDMPSAVNLTVTGGLTLNDVDLQDTHTISVNSTGALGTLTIPSSVSASGNTARPVAWSYSVAAADLRTATGDARVDSFVLTITDSRGESVTKTININLDRAAVFAVGMGDAVTASTSGTNATGSVSFTDADTADKHLFTWKVLNDAPAQGTFTAQMTADSNGGATGHITWNYTIDPNSAAYLALGSGQSLTETFVLSLNGGQSTQNVSVTINGANHPIAFGAASSIGDVRYIQNSSRATGMSITADGSKMSLSGNGDTQRLYNLVSGTITDIGSANPDSNGNPVTPNAGFGWWNSFSFNTAGTKIVFQSEASNLTSTADNNNTTDIFVKDLTTGLNTLVSTNNSTGAAAAARASYVPIFVPNSNKVLFVTNATNIVSSDNNFASDIILKDLTTGVSTIVSKSASGVLGNADSWLATPYRVNSTGTQVVSSDGTQVLFFSKASNLIDGVKINSGGTNLYVKNLNTNAVTLVSGSIGNNPLAAGGGIGEASFSPNGTKVAFITSAPEVGGDNYHVKLVIKDLLTGQISIVPINQIASALWSQSAPIWSPDGTRIAFISSAADLITGDTNNTPDIFMKDLRTGDIVRVSQNANGQSNTMVDGAIEMVFGSDGSTIYFSNTGTNLTTDVFTDPTLRHLFAKTVSLPTASDAMYNGQLKGFLTFSDADAGNTPRIVSTTVKNGTTAIGTLTAVIDSTQQGRINWVYSASPNTIDTSIAAGGSRVDTFTITLTDDAGSTITRDVAIQVVNDATRSTMSAAPVMAAAPVLGSVKFLDTNSMGGQVSGDANNIAYSRDGTKILFGGSAGNVVANDTNGAADVFVKDLSNNAVQRISTSNDGVQGNNHSGGAAWATFNAGEFNADASKVVFQTSAALVNGDTNSYDDIMIKDLSSGTLTRVSTTSTGGQAINGHSSAAQFMPNETKILFMSSATNLAATDGNGVSDVFIKNTSTGVVTLVSSNSSGTIGNGASSIGQVNQSVSPDGNLVVFTSSASNLVATDTNGVSDVFVKNLTTGAITRVSETNTGIAGNAASSWGVINPNGTKVAFISSAKNLTAGATNNNNDIFIKDLTTGIITLVPHNFTVTYYNDNLSDLSWSPDGTKLTFLMAGNPQQDAGVFDLITGTATRIESGSSSSHTIGTRWSNDGSAVAISTFRQFTGLTDTNGGLDIVQQVVGNARASDVMNGNTVRGFINFTDANIGEAHSVSAAVKGGTTALGTLSITKAYEPNASNGSVGRLDWTYTIAPSTIDTGITAGALRNDMFTITLTDANGNTSTRDLTIEVANDASRSTVYSTQLTSSQSTLGSINLISSDMYQSTAASAGTAQWYNVPLLSADGKNVLFTSASSIAGVTTNGQWQVFSKNLDTGVITTISTDNSGALGNASSDGTASYSVDGTKVVFMSSASNLIAPGTDTNSQTDIFVKNLTTGITTRVSTDATGAQVTGGASNTVAQISADGTKVLFYSAAPNVLPSGDTNARGDLFVKNLTTGAVTRVNTDATGAQDNGISYGGAFSPDGNSVIFTSDATNLVTGDTNGKRDVFIKNLTTGAVTLVSSNFIGILGNDNAREGVFSPDGTMVAFISQATNLTASTDKNGTWRDVFVKNLLTGAVTRVSEDTSGQNNSDSVDHFNVVWSPDGTRIAFKCLSNQFDNTDTNSAYDIYVKDLRNGSLTRVNLVAGQQFNSNTTPLAWSADGTSLVFYSDATNLTPADTNTSNDIFSQVIDKPTVYGNTSITTVAGDIKFTDLNVTNTHTVTYATKNGTTALGGMLNAVVSKDTAVGNTLGNVRYTYTIAPNVLATALPTGGDASETFTITITDSNGGTTTQDVSVKAIRTNTDMVLNTTSVGDMRLVDTDSYNNIKGGYYPTLSPDGSKALFTIWNAVVGGDNNTYHNYVKDLISGKVVGASTDSAGVFANNGLNQQATFSVDGNLVAYATSATNLLASSGDSNGFNDIYIKNLTTNVTTRASTSAAGTQSNGHSSNAIFTPDSTKVAFQSSANNLISGDSNATQDIFIKNLTTGAITAVSTTSDGMLGNSDAYVDDGVWGTSRLTNQAFTKDGTQMVFTSKSTNLLRTNGSSAAALGATANTGTWKPSTLGSSLKLWLDAADSSTITTDGSGYVAAWNDKSGNSLNATQATAANKPIYSNGSLVFDGSNDFLSIASIPNTIAWTSGFSTAVVAQTSSSTYIQGIFNFSNGSTSDNIKLETTNYGVNIASFNGSTDTHYWNNNILSSEKRLLTYSQAAGAAGSTAWGNTWLDGVYSFAPLLYTPNAVTRTTNYIGGGNGSAYYNGTMSDIILTNATLSTSDRQKLEGYLAWKWFGGGTANNLPDDHPYKWDGTLFGGTLITNKSTAWQKDFDLNNDIFIKNITTGAISMLNPYADGIKGSYAFGSPVFSPDGTKVAFITNDPNLVRGDSNGKYDIFVKDLLNGSVTRISTDSNGQQALNDDSMLPVWSPDGTRILFQSKSNTLAANDTNGAADYYVKDLLTGTLTRVNTDTNGSQSLIGVSRSDEATWSGDGSTIVFEDNGTLTPIDTNGSTDIFTKVLYNPTASDVSGAISGYLTFTDSKLAHSVTVTAKTNALATNALSASIAYEGSTASGGVGRINWTYTPTASSIDTTVAAGGSVDEVFTINLTDAAGYTVSKDLTITVRNDQTRTTQNVAPTLVASSSVGDVWRLPNAQAGNVYNPTGTGGMFAANDSKILFTHGYSNFVPGDANGNNTDIVIKDLATQKFTAVSVKDSGLSFATGNSTNPFMSSDGTKVVFQSTSSDYSAVADASGNTNIFLKNMTDNSITVVNKSAAGVLASNGSISSLHGFLGTSTDKVVFTSNANNLTTDGYAGNDVFVKNLTTNTVTLVDTKADGTQGNMGAQAFNGGGVINNISDNSGTKVVFDTASTNLNGSDTDGFSDVYIKNLSDNSLTLVSTRADGVKGNGNSLYASISPDGTKVAFWSDATNLLTTSDTNGIRDLFVKNLSTGTVARVNTTTAGAQDTVATSGTDQVIAWSSDSTRIAFASGSTALVTGDTNGQVDIFVKDLVDGTLTRVNTSVTGDQALGGGSYYPAFNSSGTQVIYTSWANNLLANKVAGSDIVTKTIAANARVVDNADLTTLTAQGSFMFNDFNTTDTHTVSVVNTSGFSGNIGTLTPTLVSDSLSGNSGVVKWSYSVSHTAVDALTDNVTTPQSFDVRVFDGVNTITKTVVIDLIDPTSMMI